MTWRESLLERVERRLDHLIALDGAAVAADQPRMGYQSGEWGAGQPGHRAQEARAVREHFQDRYDRSWAQDARAASILWNPGLSAQGTGRWREPWAGSDAGMWPAAAVDEPTYVVRTDDGLLIHIP